MYYVNTAFPIRFLARGCGFAGPCFIVCSLYAAALLKRSFSRLHSSSSAFQPPYKLCLNLQEGFELTTRIFGHFGSCGAACLCTIHGGTDPDWQPWGGPRNYWSVKKVLNWPTHRVNRNIEHMWKRDFTKALRPSMRAVLEGKPTGSTWSGVYRSHIIVRGGLGLIPACSAQLYFLFQKCKSQIWPMPDCRVNSLKPRDSGV